MNKHTPMGSNPHDRSLPDARIEPVNRSGETSARRQSMPAPSIRRGTNRGNGPKPFSPWNVTCFLIGGIHFAAIPIVGVVRGSELGIAAAFPFVLKSLFRQLKDRRVFTLFLLGLLWAISQFASDIVNNIPRDKSLKGLANIASILGAFAFFLGCYGVNPRSHWFFLAGRTISGMLSIFLFRGAIESTGSNDQLWDHYVGDWGLIAFILFANLVIEWSPSAVVLCGMMYGAVAIGLGGRSDGAIAILASALIAYGFLFKTRIQVRLQGKDIARLALVAILIFIPIHLIYVSLALKGTLGASSRRQLELTLNPYNPIYFLLSARSESLVSIAAIKDKPLLGHGSWAYNPQYDAIYSWNLSQLRGKPTKYVNQYKVIPSHSVLLGAWLHGGILGAVFWIYAGYLVVIEGARHLQHGSKFSMIVAAVFLAMSAWHILFSPMSFARYTWPANLAYLMSAGVLPGGRSVFRGRR